MLSAAMSPAALLAGIVFGYAVDLGLKRCKRRKSTSTTPAKVSSETARTEPAATSEVVSKKVSKDDQQMVFRPSAPALPVLTSKQLKRLNRALGTPLKTKMLLRTGGKDARTLVDATEELYQNSGLTFDDFADVVNTTVS